MPREQSEQLVLPLICLQWLCFKHFNKLGLGENANTGRFRVVQPRRGAGTCDDAVGGSAHAAAKVREFQPPATVLHNSMPAAGFRSARALSEKPLGLWPACRGASCLPSENGRTMALEARPFVGGGSIETPRSSKPSVGGLWRDQSATLEESP